MMEVNEQSIMLPVQKQNERIVFEQKDSEGCPVLWWKGGKLYDILAYKGRKDFGEDMEDLKYKERRIMLGAVMLA